jgi:membrane protease YdiL (CAAX protease family)
MSEPPSLQQRTAATIPAGSEPNPRGALALAALLAGVLVVWFLLFRRFGSGDVYAVVGPYACAVSGVLIALRHAAIREWLRPDARSIAIGVAVGVGMTLLTYPIFRLAAELWPGLTANVIGLYAGARSTTLPKALAWMLAVILAEELLFRGVLPDVLSNWMAPRAAYALTLLIYALAQFGTGSVVVLLMAVVCGTVWSIQRVLTGSLASCLVAHLIWSPTVILFYPVT